MLNAIRTAGLEAHRDRTSVIRTYLNTDHANTVLGAYHVTGVGDVTGQGVGAFRIAGGELRLVRRLGGGPG